ncbi:PIG-L deacetylase family protein [Natronoarchaeum sp. GCM10025703]|uniref:PIG-L deacetylase family protein n=1 Tax=unclassified Natronoarchaeum TaxID=2620183 RepID=UPI0036157D00
MNIVAIGAHPDDIEIGAGGSVALHRAEGHTIDFIVVTSGGELSNTAKRERECERAAEILDVDNLHFLGYTDTEVAYGGELVKQIDDILESVGADRVYIHSEKDTHQDHRNTALASIAAARNVDEVLSFESPSTRSSFAPEYYSPMPESVLKKKIEAIRTHESQSEKKYLEAEAMEGLARFRGRQANTRYAEAFQVIRIKQDPRN